MKKSPKMKLANSLMTNQNLNKRALDMKNSWDSIDKMLKNANILKKNPNSSEKKPTK